MTNADILKCTSYSITYDWNHMVREKAKGFFLPLFEVKAGQVVLFKHIQTDSDLSVFTLYKLMIIVLLLDPGKRDLCPELHALQAPLCSLPTMLIPTGPGGAQTTERRVGPY